MYTILFTVEHLIKVLEESWWCFPERDIYNVLQML